MKPNFALCSGRPAAFGKEWMTMGRAGTFAAGAAALAILTSVAWAEPLPDRAFGVWSVGECGGDTLAVMVNSTSALMVENREGEAAVAVGRAEWAGGSIVVTMKGEPGELILPPLNGLRRCEALPGVMPLLFAEAVAVFGRLDEIDAACDAETGTAAHCLVQGFDIVDITGDGRFSRAEMSRVFQAAGFFVGYRMVADRRGDAFAPLGELYLAQVAATILGPLLATNLIDSYDFDGDGFLTLDELTFDRRPEEGLEAALASLASGMAPEALSAAMEAITGIIGAFR